jgi:hypothetical protein
MKVLVPVWMSQAELPAFDYTEQDAGEVTYQFTKHYFSGIQVWNLVLQAQKATERDGPFSSNTTFPNAWYYAAISSNNPVIELPN